MLFWNCVIYLLICHPHQSDISDWYILECWIYWSIFLYVWKVHFSTHFVDIGSCFPITKFHCNTEHNTNDHVHNDMCHVCMHGTCLQLALQVCVEFVNIAFSCWFRTTGARFEHWATWGTCSFFSSSWHCFVHVIKGGSWGARDSNLRLACT